MAKDFSDAFITEMEQSSNRPILILSIYFGSERGTWRLTSLDEEVEITYDDPSFLKEP